MNLRKGRGIEMRVIAPAHMPQPVLDIGPRFFDIERPQVIRRNYPLLELAHFGALQDAAKLGLPHQKALYKRTRAHLKVRQHAQLFNRALREVLRLVNDQQRATTLVVEHLEMLLQTGEQRRFIFAGRGQAEGRRNQSQQIIGVDLRADDLHWHDRIILDTPEQAAKEGGLACPHVASDDDEAFALMQSIFKIGERALVASAAEEKIGVGVELKGLGAQTEMTLVHGWPAGL